MYNYRRRSSYYHTEEAARNPYFLSEDNHPYDPLRASYYSPQQQQKPYPHDKNTRNRTRDYRRSMSYSEQDPEYESPHGYNHYIPTTAAPKQRRSSLSIPYNQPHEDLSYMSSPYQNHEEVTYPSPPPKLNPIDQRKRTVQPRADNKKYTFPVTPDDERGSFVYADKQDEEDEGEHEEHANDSYMSYNNGAGSVMYSEGEEEEDQDPTTQMNTLYNSTSNSNNPGELITVNHENMEAKEPATLNTVDDNQKDLASAEQRKMPWFKNMISSAALVFKKSLSYTKKKSTITTPPYNAMPLSNKNNRPAIQVISTSNNESIGDVLNSSQQKEIFNQLSSGQISPAVEMPLEKTKITSLDRIWVFRLIEQNQQNDHPIAWTGFDYENQLRIESHVQELENGLLEEGHLALYDSHIRRKQMPVIVTPKQQKGYYFVDINQSTLVTLEVTFIENHHQKVTFVYRI